MVASAQPVGRERIGAEQREDAEAERKIDKVQHLILSVCVERIWTYARRNKTSIGIRGRIYKDGIKTDRY